MRTISSLLSACLLAFFFTDYTLRADDTVIVHEWGTFTCLQDESGSAIQGINVDDEPVPSFVCQTGGVNVTDEYSESKGNFGLPPYQNFHVKGWTPGDPQVTMRLETPVIYFYPPKGQIPASIPPLNVHVEFHDGVLSQYYPYADFDVLQNTTLSKISGTVDSLIFRTGDLYGTTSSLTWNGVRLGSTEKPIETSDKVWTTPREVSAPLLEVKAPFYSEKGVRQDKPQAEHFLFYRGVGHLDSPLKTGVMKALTGTLAGIGHESATVFVSPQVGAPPLASYTATWLADIRADGTCFFRADDLPDVGKPDPKNPSWIRSSGLGLNLDLTFKEPYTAVNLTKLQAEMHAALIKAGLYPDEATAMLKTWELSYFKSPGLRFFYIVPRAWTDKILPLKITGAPTEITRVMVGRIELITDTQKAALARLGAGPCPDLASVKMTALNALENSKLPQDEVEAFYRGEKPLSDLGITIPPLVQDYLSLGRFRDALIVHEQQTHPSPVLAQFIKDNQLASQEN